MTRSITLYLISLIALPATCIAQDTIFLNKQRQVYAKVLEVEEAKIKYKKYENLEDRFILLIKPRFWLFITVTEHVMFSILLPQL